MHTTLSDITADERELLLTAARSLNREVKQLDKTKYKYKDDAINDFNENYNIIELFVQNQWTIVSQSDNEIRLLRPGGNSGSSGVYFIDNHVFMCHSSSTLFPVATPQCHFQVLMILMQYDHQQAKKFIENLGYQTTVSNTKSQKVVSDSELADFLCDSGLRYNEIVQDITLNDEILQEMDLNTLYLEAKNHFGCPVPRSNFDYVINSHYITKENPVKSFIEDNIHLINDDINVSLNGEIRKWVDCLEIVNDREKEIVTHFFRKWLVGLVAQCLDGKFPNELFLALLSIAHGIGKTTLARDYILPQKIRKYRREVSLSDDKDFKLVMAQSILICDDEMDGRTFGQDKTFKSLLSLREMNIRKVYDKRLTTLIRRASFLGTGNQLSVVRERHNRRVIPIEIASIDRVKLAQVDLDKMFMEAYHLFKEGFTYSYEYTDNDKLKVIADDYLVKSTYDEILEDCIYLPENESDIHQIASLDLLERFENRYSSLNLKMNSITLGKIMQNYGVNSRRVGKNKKTVYCISSKSKILQPFDYEEVLTKDDKADETIKDFFGL
jgi:hypothetical protein